MRAGRDADIPDVERLVEAAFAPFVTETGIRPAPLSTDWPTVVSALGLMVATADERVVGALVVWPHPDHVLVETVAVDPASQHLGAGTALLGVAERLAIESGTNTVRLSTNTAMTANRAYYSRRGFVETGRGPEQGYDRVRFEKRLQP